MKKFLSITVYAILTIILSFNFTYGKSFEGTESHKKDFCDCLGVNCKPNDGYVDSLRKFSNLIDDADEFYNELKNIYQFKRGHYGHRILFHWGFNDDPRQSAVLKQQVELSVPQSQQESFYKYLISEQARRNKKMEKIIRTGFNVQNKKAHALTTILYDIHILGDYSCKSCTILEPLCAIDRVKKDITKHGIRKLVPDRGSNYAILKQINSVKKTYSDKEYAYALLDALKKELPKFLSDNSDSIFLDGLDTKNSIFSDFSKFFRKN
jgi:hypothetical protein